MIKLIDKEYKVDLDAKMHFLEQCKFISETIQEVNIQLVKQEEEIEQDYWKKIGDITDISPDDHEFYQQDCEELLDKHRNLPQILFKSLIVSVYSILETTISDITKALEKKVPKSVKLKHLKTKGSEIENSIQFLTLVYNLDFNSINQVHEEIKLFADLRNNIVHKNGNLKEENEQRKNRIKKFIKNNNKVEIVENKIFINESELILDYLKLIRKFSIKFFELIVIPKSQH